MFGGGGSNIGGEQTQYTIPPPSPSPLSPPPLPRQLLNVTDDLQPRADTGERNLCTPTAFGSLFRFLYDQGLVTSFGQVDQNSGNTVSYDPHQPFGQPGWANAAWGINPNPPLASFNDYHAHQQLAFNWWFNTNNQGPTSRGPPGLPLDSPIGTMTQNALYGAMEAFSKTDPNLHPKSGYYYHTPNSPTPQPHIYNFIVDEKDPIQTFDAFKTSIQNNRPVILFLDSYSVSSSQTFMDVEGQSIEIFDLKSFASLVPDGGPDEEKNEYIQNSDDPGNAVGHTVVLVGYHETTTAGCKYVIVQDNEGTTPRFVALAFDDVNCGSGGGRALFPPSNTAPALLASFFVDPLGYLLPIVPSSLPSPPPPSALSSSPPPPSSTSPSPVSPPTSSSLSLSPPPSPPSPRPPFAPLSASQAVVETQATVMSIRFTVDATLETFASQDFETTLRTKTQCESPSCFLQMDVSAGSVIVDARFIVPNTQPSETVDEIQTATQTLVPADFPNATIQNMTEVVTRTNVTLPIVVDVEPSAFPPPMPLSTDYYDMLTLYLVSTFTFVSFLMAIMSFGWHRMRRGKK